MIVFSGLMLWLMSPIKNNNPDSRGIEKGRREKRGIVKHRKQLKCQITDSLNELQYTVLICPLLILLNTGAFSVKESHRWSGTDCVVLQFVSRERENLFLYDQRGFGLRIQKFSCITTQKVFIIISPQTCVSMWMTVSSVVTTVVNVGIYFFSDWMGNKRKPAQIYKPSTELKVHRQILLESRGHQHWKHPVW